MRPPELRLFSDELIVDNFAGGGGASEGIRIATGREPDFAINHDPEAIAMHARNHPSTTHVCGDVFDVRPRELVAGRPVGLAWFSPDCTFHSKARGGKPFRDPKEARGRRGLAWVVVRWAREVKPRVILLENVEEFKDWGPLGDDGRPCTERRGLTFRRWVGSLRSAGYAVEWRELRACDFGAPTTRKRLFVIARCDGAPIVWPEPTHGPGRRPFRTAAECIEWTMPCPSIFARHRPLADKTMARIARGVRRFVLESGRPFIVPTAHGGDLRVAGIDGPIRTICASRRGDHALVAPTLIHTGNGERQEQAPRVYDIETPLGTIVATGQKHALVSGFLAKHNGGHEATGSSLSEPMHTLTTKDNKGLAVAHLAHHQQREARTAEVRAFLMKYYGTAIGQDAQPPLGTVTTRDRFGVVIVDGVHHEIADIGLRMLAPRELFRAQGFGDHYVIDSTVDGATLTKTAQIRMVGNSVSPPIAAALVRANLAVGYVQRAAS